MNAVFSKWILTLTALATALLPLLFDANSTALFNPDWSGHARYHTVMVLTLGLEAGLLATWLLWGAPGRSAFGARTAALVQAIFWGGYLVAALVPGTALPAPGAGATGLGGVRIVASWGWIGGVAALVLLGWALAGRPASAEVAVVRPRLRGDGGRLALGLAALVTLIGAPLFDFNAGHVFNPAWAPYARYHVAVHVPVTMALMLAAVWLLWRRWPGRQPDVTFSTAALLVLAFWVTFFTAEWTPGTATGDPGQPVPMIGSLPVHQLTAAIPFVLLIALAAVLYRRNRATPAGA